MPALPPQKASELALGIYDINSGDDRRVKAYLSNRLFSQQASSVAHLKAEVGGRLLRSAKDSFGVGAVGANEYAGDLFLIFRGTTMANKKADVITDARFGITYNQSGLPVHIGFNHAFSSMRDDIKAFIASTKAQGSIHCIGHSLGGAVACLAADWAARSTSLTPKLYTFGAPRVGTDWFVNSTTSVVGSQNMYRAYHKTDPVPMVPLYPFMQAPGSTAGYFLGSSEPLLSGAAHSMAKYVKSVSAKSWDSLKNTNTYKCNIESAIESWLTSKSPVSASSAQFWQWVEAAIVFVLKKLTMSAFLAMQGALIGVFTLADKLAYLLAKGIELGDKVSIWVEHLMRKIMSALGMKVVSSKRELQRSLIQKVLRQLTEEANRHAHNALRKL